MAALKEGKSMKRDGLTAIEEALMDIPNATFKVERHTPASQNDILFAEQFHSKTEGKGRITVYQIFPGIELSLNLFLAE